jgi:hypothetical protein
LSGQSCAYSARSRRRTPRCALIALADSGPTVLAWCAVESSELIRRARSVATAREPKATAKRGDLCHGTRSAPRYDGAPIAILGCDPRSTVATGSAWRQRLGELYNHRRRDENAVSGKAQARPTAVLRRRVTDDHQARHRPLFAPELSLGTVWATGRRHRRLLPLLRQRRCRAARPRPAAQGDGASLGISGSRDPKVRRAVASPRSRCRSPASTGAPRQMKPERPVAYNVPTGLSHAREIRRQHSGMTCPA